MNETVQVTSQNTRRMEVWQLRARQALPLEKKVEISLSRIKQFYDHYNSLVEINYSGGIDSEVVRHLAWSIFPDIPAVHVDTGLEYPQIKDHVKKSDTVILRPKVSYATICKTEGYPILSKQISHQLRALQNPNEHNQATRTLYLTGIKRDGTYSPRFKLAEKYHYLIDAPFKFSDRCCDLLKKNPLKKYQKETGRKPILGIMAEDSQIRERNYLMHGCNKFDSADPISSPIAFWTNNDVWNYIRSRKIDYCKIYDTGVKHTGCMYCMFGIHLEKQPNRFQIMSSTHPQLYNYCIEKIGVGKVLDYINIPYHRSQTHLEVS